MNDGAGTGTCVIVFNTEDDTKAAIAPMTRAGGPPVITSGVYEVEIEA